MKEEDRPKKELSSQGDLHLTYLHSLGLEVDKLTLNLWVKCHKGGEAGDPRNAYRCGEKLMACGAVGLGTVVRLGSEWLSPYLTRPDEEPSANNSFFGLSPLEQETAAPSQPVEQTVAELSYIHNFWGRSMSRGISEYLKNKGVGAHGVRFRQSSEFGQAAVVPMKDLSGNLKGLQLLNGNGKPKQMLKGSRVTGNCHLIGKIGTDGELLLCEGYATGAFLYEQLAVPVCICFSSSNLMPVAGAVRKKYPGLRLVIAGDNDRHLPRNEGAESARAAAAAVDGKVAIPDFAAIPPAKDATDWLDLARLLGTMSAIAQLNGI